LPSRLEAIRRLVELGLRAKGKMRAARLQELEEIAAKLLIANLLRGRTGATYFRRSGDFVRK
jgi:hypothetical protein